MARSKQRHSHGTPAVADAGVIGVPDEVADELVKAFMSLRKGFTASEDLADEIRGHARSRLGAAVAPREIQFMDNLPRTQRQDHAPALEGARARFA
ncbi:MAG: hypothetical protein U1F40_00610 [Turneriella sp.]